LMKWKVSFVACFVSVAIACRDAGVAPRGSASIYDVCRLYLEQTHGCSRFYDQTRQNEEVITKKSQFGLNQLHTIMAS
jgi:hypothetical protein